MDIILSYYYVSQWFSRGCGNTQIEKYVGHIYFQHVLNPCLKVQTPITDNLSILAYHILGYQEGVIFGA